MANTAFNNKACPLICVSDVKKLLFFFNIYPLAFISFKKCFFHATVFMTEESLVCKCTLLGSFSFSLQNNNNNKKGGGEGF